MQVPPPARALLTALEVQDLLHIDRSTVYRMAEDGRLPAIRVGRSWRFPAERIQALLHATVDRESGPTGDVDAPSPIDASATNGAGGAGLPEHAIDANADAYADSGPVRTSAGSRLHEVDLDTAAAQAAVEVAGDLLGVMMVVTDMHGRPLTDVAHPCPWYLTRADDPAVLDQCVAEWHDLADHPDLTPRFQQGALGFECARAFIRRGSTLVGMVLAGGVSASPDAADDPDLYHLDETQRQQVLTALPRIAAAISTAPRTGATPHPAPRSAAATHEAPAGAALKEN
jgi:excisionase family DNA binding protein